MREGLEGLEGLVGLWQSDPPHLPYQAFSAVQAWSSGR